jgi:hypothetical protein
MRYKVYIIAVLGFFLLSGCKSLGRLTSKDQSSARGQAGSSSSMPRGFLDNIAVLPGEVKVAGVKVAAPPVAETEPKKMWALLTTQHFHYPINMPTYLALHLLV